MFDQLKDGFVALFLVLGQWILPAADRPGLAVEPHMLLDGYEIRCNIDMAWNEQFSALVDAGIPLRIRMTGTSNAGDTIACQRTLQYHVAANSYHFVDTVKSVTSDSVSLSKEFPQVLLALRDYTHWSFVVSKKATSCRLEIVMLPSYASRLKRTVDMSALWGQSRLAKVVILR